MQKNDVLPDLCSAHEVTFLVEASWSEPDSLIPDFFWLTVGVEKFSVDSLVSDDLKFKILGKSLFLPENSSFL